MGQKLGFKHTPATRTLMRKRWHERPLHIREAIIQRLGPSKRGMFRDKAPNWKGGITYRHGYCLIRVAFGDGRRNYILEHTYVMEEHLGRALRPHEVIHHRNGIKTDNRLENLELLTDKEHRYRHERDLAAAKHHAPRKSSSH